VGSSEIQPLSLGAAGIDKVIDPEVGNVLSQFYDAFNALDAKKMASFYHEQASFTDPAFPDLRGERIGMMWAMMCRRAKNFELTYKVLFADERKAQVAWEAKYLYGGKRKVTNHILSSLSLWDGLIVRQVDEFDFARWAKQALGLPGLLAGNTEWLRRKVQVTAADQLNQFIITHYQDHQDSQYLK
jgi:SnoaL-like domain